MRTDVVAATAWAFAALLVLAGGCSLQSSSPPQGKIVTRRAKRPHSVEARLFPPASPESQGMSTARLAELSALLHRWCTSGRLSGAELLVVKNRRTVLHDSAGWRDRQRGLSMQRNQSFVLGPFTEPVTGTVAQRLVDEGVLSLESRVAEYLPAFDCPGKREIQLRHLLAHQSGLAVQLPAGSLEGPGDVGQLAAAWARLDQDFPAGTRFRYSHGDVVVLAALLERCAGRPLNDEIRERVITPLGLQDTGNTPDGRIYSTALDYARFLAAWVDAAESEGSNWLSSGAARRAWQPQTDVPLPTGFAETPISYGHKWMVAQHAEPAKSHPLRLFGHAGPAGSLAWVWPEQDLIVVCFCYVGDLSTRLALEAAIQENLLQATENSVAVLPAVPSQTPPAVQRESTGGAQGL